MNPILEALSKRVFFADGGMGTLLQERGLQPGETPERWNFDRAKDLREIHAAYFRAGSDFVLANTFGANGAKLNGTGLEVEATVAAAIANARAAADEVEREDGRKRFVALDIGPTGHLLKPNGDLHFSDACAFFAEQVKAGVKAGADLIAIETMSDVHELKAAVIAAKENSGLPIFATVAFGEDGKLLTGADVETVTAILEGLRVDAIGMNCGLGPHEMLPLVERMVAVSSTPIMVEPNAGLPRVVEGKTIFDVAPEEFAQVVRKMVEAGVRIIGGCCGTTPAHLAAEYKSCADFPVRPIEKKKRCVITSYDRALELKLNDTYIIGERINPTGKARLKQALREHDMAYLLREGVNQQEAGAHILDVNVGLPGIDEPAMMQEAVESLQAVIDLPLQLDSSDAEALERGLRQYNGKALVNSVNGTEKVMRSVFPLVAKYGGVVIALTLDETGIPPTSQGRLEIAKRILAVANEYDLDKDDLVVDCLCMAVSAMPDAGRITLETLRRVREELGMRTCLGVSNVSFGLPARPQLNSAFYTLAMGAGLSTAIINPCAPAMMAAWRSYRALNGLDTQCGEFIAHAEEMNAVFGSAAQTAKPQEAATAQTPFAELFGAVKRGLKEEARNASEKLLADGAKPVELIDGAIVPALDEVGKGFEKHTIFLPQLLMAAEAAGAAFEAVKREMVKSGTQGASKGPVVIATVKGDIHDIGKNIVRALLENYGFRVIDLGRDVDENVILDAVRENNCKLVGLSALMTTTVANMETAIKLLHEKAPDCKIMVGGAVLTADYAKEINADFYSKEAMESVRIAERVFGE